MNKYRRTTGQIYHTKGLSRARHQVFEGNKAKIWRRKNEAAAKVRPTCNFVHFCIYQSHAYYDLSQIVYLPFCHSMRNFELRLALLGTRALHRQLPLLCSLWFASSSIYAVCFLFHILAWYPDLEFVLKSKLLFWITSENQSPACIESAKSANLLALCIAIVIIYCRTSNYDSSYY